ncbi:type I-E CRISPR-associated protein Cse2/CasB [Streptomyces sp. NPDC007100]|uniref:type I-E CRISPR-associated protein Cse2/CasB n=1 Tax=Streptomyces sp. NPDC007100 TaxID=3155602 RepID=UPI0034020D12
MGLDRAFAHGQPPSDLSVRQAFGPARTTSSSRSVRHAETDTDRPAFGLTASLFALYHAALPWRDGVRLYGSGDLGQALRRAGTGAFQGPKGPGCQRLFERLVAPGPLHRKEVLLQHAVTRLRTQDRFPPSWAQLAADLSGWAARGNPSNPPHPRRPPRHRPAPDLRLPPAHPHRTLGTAPDHHLEPLMTQTLTHGIGHSRAYGCGLLLAQPVKNQQSPSNTPAREGSAPCVRE